jgi:glycerol uptake facilitator-like aquaporin
MRNWFARERIAAVVAEFLGTGVLTLMFLSVKNSQIGVPFFVALAAGLAVAMMMFAVGRTSGANLNPALTLGLWTARKISTVSGVLYIIAQLLGAWAAYGLFTYIVNTSLPNPKAHYTTHALVTEAVGSGILAFGWAAALYQGYSRAVTAAVAGLSYIVGIVSVSVFSIALLNPAVALGMRSWVWGTFVLGPVIGAVIGVNLYGLLFAGPEAVAAGASAAANGGASTSGVAKKPAAKRGSRRGRK